MLRVKSRRSVAEPAKAVHETTEHARLKTTLKDIADRSGFRVDTEVVLNFSGNRDPECSIDVAMFGSTDGVPYLLIFECKGGGDLPEPHKKMSAWNEHIRNIQSGDFTVLKSDSNSLHKTDIAGVANIRVCYVFGKNMDPEKFNATARTLRGRKFYAWDNLALTYYIRTAHTIRTAAKYQILREFDFNLEPSAAYLEDAVEIKQNGLEMYLLGVKPSVLLKIAYVSRRASGRLSAYQRILSAERIDKVSEFLRSRNALLPNAIIIAFDKEREVQKHLYFKDGKLHFPSLYCSAWIIDGQHRVYGFRDTKYEVEYDDPKKQFKLPVVAFKNMDILLQNRTFVSINYNQKRIDPTLLCDLATELPDLNNELTWPSLLVTELNKLQPLKNKIKISELDQARPITITSFARYGLLEGLLGFERKSRSYRGPLHTYSPFSPKASVKSSANRASMEKQVVLLKRFFDAVHHNTTKPHEAKDPWRNMRKYSLLKPTGINALLLVLSRLLKKYPRVEHDMNKDLRAYLKPLRRVRFTRSYVAKQGGGWKGFRSLANVMLKQLNKINSDNLKLFGAKEKI